MTADPHLSPPIDSGDAPAADHAGARHRTGGPLDAGRLHLLREAALRGSISAASRSLGLTPSAVSQQLSALERDVGVTLLHRSARGTTLTGAGRALVARAEQVADVLAQAQADLERLGGIHTGSVSIASVASAAIAFVSSGITRLGREQPGIDASVTVCEPTSSLDLVAGGDTDIAIIDEYDYVPVSLPDHTEVRELLTEPLVVVAPDTATVPTMPRLTDLADARWVMPPDDAACGRALRSACRAAGFEPDVRWESDDMLVLAEAVKAGHGLSVIPRLSVDPDQHGIQVGELRSPGIHRRLLAVARTSTLARPVVAEVLDALTHEAATTQEAGT